MSNRLENYIEFPVSAGFSSVEDKDMIGMDNDRLNTLLNLSPTLGLNYDLITNDIGSFYAGGAISYSRLILNVNKDDNTFKGSTPGLKLNFGYSPSLSDLKYEIQFNIAKAKAIHKNPNWSAVEYPDNLSFTGLGLHVR